MIIARIDGGLGNQMFQYAYGLYLARRHDTELVLDLSSYEAQPQHGYLLDRLCVEAETVGPELRAFIPRRYRGTSSRFSLRDVWGGGGLRRTKESPFGFQSKYLATPDHRYLVGYWQSEKFFPGIRSDLLKHFSLRSPLSPASQEVADKIRQTNSAVIHLRRGDYLTNPQAAKLYQPLDLAYYVQSLHAWASTQANVEVFVFSNDMPWCRQNLNLPWKTHWVDHNGSDTAHEDMFLMSQAACCVIANSTFSWWAAWLNDRPGKTVYAPRTWFRPGTMDGSHILCHGWNSFPTSLSRAA